MSLNCKRDPTDRRYRLRALVLYFHILISGDKKIRKTSDNKATSDFLQDILEQDTYFFETY